MKVGVWGGEQVEGTSRHDPTQTFQSINISPHHLLIPFCLMRPFHFVSCPFTVKYLAQAEVMQNSNVFYLKRFAVALFHRNSGTLPSTSYISLFWEIKHRGLKVIDVEVGPCENHRG